MTTSGTPALGLQRRTLVLAAGGGTVSTGAGVVLARTWLHRGPSPGLRVPTSFGSVALVGSSRTGTAEAGRGGHDTHSAAHSAPSSVEFPASSAVHGAWTSGVVVEVVARNAGAKPVQLSPGQFRVRVDGGGPTVSLYSSDHEATPLEPGAARTMRIAYLAPSPDRMLSLEFTDTGRSRALRLGSVGDGPTRGGRL